MVAASFLFAAFCLLGEGAMAGTKIHQNAAASVSPECSGVQCSSISHNIAMELHMRQRKMRPARGIVGDLSPVGAASASAPARHNQPEPPRFMQTVSDIQVAFAAVVEAVAQFEAGTIQEGIVTILNAAEALIAKYVPEDVANQLKEYKVLIEQAINSTKDIEANIKAFKETGDTEKLATALLRILDEIEEIVAYFETDIEGIEPGSIVKYFEALEEIISGTSSSWSAFTAKANSEDIVSAMESIYASIRAAVLKIVPKEDITEELEIALTVFDSTIGNLTTIVQEFKQELELKVLCLPRSLSRIGKTPDVCPQGFANEGSRCIAKPGRGGDCWEACGSKPGNCDSYCGAHTNGDKTVCCKEGEEDSCECKGATGFVVNNPAHPANSYHQCVTAGPFVQASSLSETVDKTLTRKNEPAKPKCIQGASALVEKSLQHKNEPAPPRGSTQAKCSEGELCDKKCIQPCPAGSEPNGCKCRAMCTGEHPAHQKILGLDICVADAISMVSYATDALAAGATLASLIDYMAREDSIKELNGTIQAGIALIRKLVIPRCATPESMRSLLPGK